MQSATITHSVLCNATKEQLMTIVVLFPLTVQRPHYNSQTHSDLTWLISRIKNLIIPLHIWFTIIRNLSPASNTHMIDGLNYLKSLSAQIPVCEDFFFSFLKGIVEISRKNVAEIKIILHFLPTFQQTNTPIPTGADS